MATCLYIVKLQIVETNNSLSLYMYIYTYNIYIYTYVCMYVRMYVCTYVVIFVKRALSSQLLRVEAFVHMSRFRQGAPDLNPEKGLRV